MTGSSRASTTPSGRWPTLRGRCPARPRVWCAASSANCLGTARRARTRDDIHLVRALVTVRGPTGDDRHPRRVRCAGSACPRKRHWRVGHLDRPQDRHLESTSLAKERELHSSRSGSIARDSHRRDDRSDPVHVRSPLRINPSSRSEDASTSASRVSSTGSPPAAATDADSP